MYVLVCKIGIEVMILKLELQKQSLELSKAIIEEWYRGRTDRLIPLLDNRVSWIGARAEQFYQGKTEVAAALERVSNDIPPSCLVSEETWFIADKGADWCLCIGKFIITLENENQYLQEPQRATFLWKQSGKNLKIVHIHVSNVIHGIETDEEFLVVASARNYNYVQKKLSEKSRVLHIMTTEYEYHLVGINNVSYIEASKECLLIHTSERTYRVHEGIGSFVEKNCPRFIFTHRSYAVNSDWIKTVTPTEVILINGESLAISKQRYKSICEKLKKIFNK